MIGSYVFYLVLNTVLSDERIDPTLRKNSDFLNTVLSNYGL